MATSMRPCCRAKKPMTGGCLERMRRCAAMARLERRLDGVELAERPPSAGGPTDDGDWSRLLRLMPVALGRRVVFHRPGADKTTFDEAWLLRLMASLRCGDEDSAAFALASRVERRYRPAMHSLASRCVESLDGADTELL